MFGKIEGYDEKNTVGDIALTAEVGCELMQDHTEAVCSKINYQYADIGVPVKVTPYAKVGRIKTECVGEPTVQCGDNCSKRKDGCEVFISQNICVRIPIEYGAATRVGEPVINCGKCGSQGGCRSERD